MIDTMSAAAKSREEMTDAEMILAVIATGMTTAGVITAVLTDRGLFIRITQISSCVNSQYVTGPRDMNQRSVTVIGILITADKITRGLVSTKGLVKKDLGTGTCLESIEDQTTGEDINLLLRTVSQSCFVVCRDRDRGYDDRRY